MSDTKHHAVEQLQAQVAPLERDLHWAQLKIQVLEEKLRQQRIKMFGPRSEKLSDLQLWLLEQEQSVLAEEVAAEAERPAIEPGGAPAREEETSGEAETAGESAARGGRDRLQRRAVPVRGVRQGNAGDRAG